MSPTEFKDLLDFTHAQMMAGIVRPAFDHLTAVLTELRLTQSDEYWNDVVRPLCDNHPILELVLQDPYTRRAREKPRGYAGDAVMLDYVYSGVPPPDTSPRGAQIFSITTGSAAAEGVRWRIEYLAGQIEEVARTFRRPRIFSLASGHLRELRYSKAFAAGLIDQIVAMDQDAESLAVVAADYAGSSVLPRLGSVREILRGRVNLSGFHLVYAAGLYDYLSEAQAKALTARLFSMLAPSGKLLVPNFLVSNHGRGYMESFMDWRLIVRDREQIERCGALVPDSETETRRYFEDPFGVVGYLEITKSNRTP